MPCKNKNIRFPVIFIALVLFAFSFTRFTARDKFSAPANAEQTEEFSLNYIKEPGTDTLQDDLEITVTLVTDENREALISTVIGNSTTGETYNPATRRFQAIPGVTESAGGRLYASVMCGDNNEPNDNNYGAVGVSLDGGETYIDPLIIIDGEKVKTRVTDVMLARMPNGKIMVYYTVIDNSVITMNTGNQHGNIYADRSCYFFIENPDDPLDELRLSPVRIFGDQNGYTNIRGAWTAPVTVKENGREYLAMVMQGSGTTCSVRMYVSDDNGENWWLRSVMFPDSTNSLTFVEPSIAQLKNGDLWVMHRIEGGNMGGVGRYVSHDFGRTWERWENGLPAPLNGPGSKCAIYNLPSGNLLWVTNDSVTSRTKMTAYLSEDDGQTWYDFALDYRLYPTYPFVSTSPDNRYAYVSWDYGRGSEMEIRYAKLTEEDIKAGVVVSEEGFRNKALSKTGGFKEIVAVEENYEQLLRVKVGTVSREQLLAGLPSTLHATDEDGTAYTISGTWDASSVMPAKKGSYYIRFNTSLPGKLQDARMFTYVKVVVGENGNIIRNVKETYDRTKTVDYGTSLEAVLEGLPTTLTVTDDIGREYVLSGEWGCAAYKANKTGKYNVVFTAQNFPVNLDDASGLLKIRVNVGLNPNVPLFEDEAAETNSNVTGYIVAICVAGSVSLVSLSLISVLLVKYKKRGRQ
ncbi:MAG: sialidase family protein [Candidatus Scatosoma sp.]